MDSCDVAIVGSGFAGALLAAICERIGFSAALLERGTHPRFAIGESTSPIANLLLEELAGRYHMPALLPLCKYGKWKQAYPEIGVGPKRGFTYYHHTAGKVWSPALESTSLLMVAANVSTRTADTHWLRSDVDQFLVNHATECGARYVDRVELTALSGHPGDWTLSGTHADEPFAVKARFIVDAGGPRGFMSRLLQIPDRGFANYPQVEALFSHFEGVQLCEQMDEFATALPLPYPPDTAALHHIFDGGWMWVLRFDNGTTSAGFALQPWLARELQLEQRDPAWDRLMRRFPSIGAQFCGARALLPLKYSNCLPYCAESAAGPGWVMLPATAAFVDPLFSTGIPLSLLGIQRFAALLEASAPDIPSYSRCAELSATTLREADRIALYVKAVSSCFGNFNRFAALSMFYFAAASYSESARRLNKPALARGFLLSGDVRFCNVMDNAIAMEHREVSDGELAAYVSSAIAPWNAAGMADSSKSNLYSVDLNDLVRNAHLFDLDLKTVQRIVTAADWAKP